MTERYKQILLAIIMLLGFFTSMAIEKFPVDKVDIKVDEKEENISINISLDTKDFYIKRNGELILTPIIISGDGNECVKFDPVIICGRNRWYEYLRRGMADFPGSNIYRSGSIGFINISYTLSFQPWMVHSTIEMRRESTTCCEGAELLEGNSKNGNILIASIDYKNPVFDYDLIFSTPLSEAPVEKSLEGKAFVSFKVNKTNLEPNYLSNKTEIQKILNSIDIVKEDDDAIITSIEIKGFASPEGSYENNVRLAVGRTETLAQYVNDLYRFEKGIISTSYEPEDWEGLRNYVADSLNFKLSNREGLLAIIDGPLGFDEKDYALKTKYHADYTTLLKEIYPWLRHSDYIIKYKIKVYSDLNDLKRLYKNDPTKLRAIDFYTLANQHPEGSPEYAEIMKKSLSIYPYDPMLNLNVANLYLMEGDFEKAQSCLNKAGTDPMAIYARAILAAKRGDLMEASDYFDQAEKAGVPKAGKYLKEIKHFTSSVPVKILIETKE